MQKGICLGDGPTQNQCLMSEGVCPGNKFYVVGEVIPGENKSRESCAL